jgi:uncharacterized membrane protein
VDFRLRVPLPPGVVRGLRIAVLAITAIMLLDLVLVPPASWIEAVLYGLFVLAIAIGALLMRPRLDFDHDPAP